MKLKFASYNIRKAVGLDRRRDPERILTVLREIDADVVALQEADRRLGRRASALPLAMIHDHTHYLPVPLSMKPDSLGWHGNALLVRRGIGIVDAAPVPLPALEPRGAIRADLVVEGRAIRVVGMHLDLSGLRRKQQFAHLCNASRAPGLPAVMLGDCNEWWRPIGGERGFASHWTMVEPGRSFPSRRPMLALDRLLHTPHWRRESAGVHTSPLARQASDHLPIKVTLALHDS